MQAHIALDMDPRAELDRAGQHIVGAAQHIAGADQIAAVKQGRVFAGILQVRQADIGKEDFLQCAQDLADRQALHAGIRPIFRARHLGLGQEGGQGAVIPAPSRAAGTVEAAGLNGDGQGAIGLVLGRDGGLIAIVDRLAKPRLDPALTQPIKPPLGARRMGHIGKDIHPRHQPAGKAKFPRHIIGMDAVLAGGGGIEGDQGALLGHGQSLSDPKPGRLIQTAAHLRARKLPRSLCGSRLWSIG